MHKEVIVNRLVHMNDSDIRNIPKILPEIQLKSENIGFTMPSDIYIGALLKALIASKPSGRFLEIGTGTGLSLSWMLEGMDAESQIITVDNDPELIAIAKSFFDRDERLTIVCQNGSDWINEYRGKNFDLVFADAWPGKYSDINEVLQLINVGGFYVIDDMSAQPNWPDGHQDNVDELVSFLEKRKDFTLIKMNWSTGVIIAVKIT